MVLIIVDTHWPFLSCFCCSVHSVCFLTSKHAGVFATAVELISDGITDPGCLSELLSIAQLVLLSMPFTLSKWLYSIHIGVIHLSNLNN